MKTTCGIGNVLATGLRVWTRNLVPFLVITVLGYAPFLIWGISAVQGEIGRDQLLGLAGFEKYSFYLMLFVNIFVSAALTYGVVMELQGQRASFGACIATGLTRFFPVLGVAVVSTAVIVIGVFVLIIPGVIAACMFYVTTQAAVLERPGVWGALGRSERLTRGRRLTIFTLLLILLALAFLSGKLIFAIALPHAGDEAFAAETLQRIPLYMYLNLFRLVLLGSLFSVMAAVVYYFLRAEKEGTSAEELAHVFD